MMKENRQLSGWATMDTTIYCQSPDRVSHNGDFDPVRPAQSPTIAAKFEAHRPQPIVGSSPTVPNAEALRSDCPTPIRTPDVRSEANATKPCSAARRLCSTRLKEAVTLRRRRNIPSNLRVSPHGCSARSAAMWTPRAWPGISCASLSAEANDASRRDRDD